MVEGRRQRERKKTGRKVGERERGEKTGRERKKTGRNVGKRGGKTGRQRNKTGGR